MLVAKIPVWPLTDFLNTIPSALALLLAETDISEVLRCSKLCLTMSQKRSTWFFELAGQSSAHACNPMSCGLSEAFSGLSRSSMDLNSFHFAVAQALHS